MSSPPIACRWYFLVEMIDVCWNLLSFTIIRLLVAFTAA
jgi:hypothetical protein